MDRLNDRKRFFTTTTEVHRTATILKLTFINNTIDFLRYTENDSTVWGHNEK